MISLVAAWGYIAIFITMVGESAGLPISSEVVVPLGGALIPYVVDPADLTAASGVQVLNTKAICVRFAEMCVNFKMTHSALTYPRGKLTSEDFTRS